MDSREADLKLFESAPAVPFQRGRIHDRVDVLNGISGLEHLSNSIAVRKELPAQRNYGYGQGQLKTSGSPGAPTPTSPIPTEISSPVAPIYDKNGLQAGDPNYDPFYKNEQRYLTL